MLDILEKIPKGVNIIIFIWAVIGIVLLVHSPRFRRKRFLCFYLGIIGFMIAWRVKIGIISSRYTAGMIIPFVALASIFLYSCGKRRHAVVRYALYAFLVGSAFIYVKMDFDSMTRNHYRDVIAEVFTDLDNSGGKYTFLLDESDYRRLNMPLGFHGTVKPMNGEKFHQYVSDYKTVYPETVVNVDSKNASAYPGGLDYVKKLVSISQNEKGTKRQLIYVLTSDNQCVPVSLNRAAPYQPNLLDNGDLEILDSVEDSYRKLKSGIGQYSLFYTADEKIRTPRNACFLTDSKLSSLPEFSAANSNAIGGSHSARIRFPKGAADLMFQQHFSGGKYEYSMLVQGQTGTDVCAMYISHSDRGEQAVPLASFTIPDKRLYRITARFDFDSPGDGDFFTVGASVRNGEASLDNFSLTALDD